MLLLVGAIAEMPGNAGSTLRTRLAEDLATNSVNRQVASSKTRGQRCRESQPGTDWRNVRGDEHGMDLRFCRGIKKNYH